MSRNNIEIIDTSLFIFPRFDVCLNESLPSCSFDRCGYLINQSVTTSLKYLSNNPKQFGVSTGTILQVLELSD